MLTVIVTMASLGSLPLWPPGLFCRRVYREARGHLCPEEGHVSGLYPSEPRRALGTSLVSCHCLGIAGLPLPLQPWRAIREVPLPGLDSLLLPGSGGCSRSCHEMAPVCG